jgi:transposase-like protein
MIKRRKFTPEFKAQVAMEVISGAKSAAEACREYSLKPSVVSDWKATLMANAANTFDNPVERSREQEQIAELERMVGRQTMELEILKKASNILNSKRMRNGR